MLKRLYIPIAIVTLLYAARSYRTHVADVAQAPASNPVDQSAPDAIVTDDRDAAPARDVASAPKPERAGRGEPVPREIHQHRTRQSMGLGGDDAGAPVLGRYSHLNLSPPAQINERPYRVLGARAVRPEGYRSSLGPVLFEENGLRVFEDRAPGWNDLVTSNDGKPLMVNPANGRLVVVTGTLKVVVADADRAAQLAASEHLQLLHFDPSIKLAFYKTPAGFHLLPAVTRIGASPGVSLVELETIESRAVPR